MKGAVGIVQEVDNISRLVLKKPVDGPGKGNGCTFKVLPKVDQSGNKI